MMVMFDWGDGTCSYMAQDCPTDPAMLDAACGLASCYCEAWCTANCVTARFTKAKSQKHAYHSDLKHANKKRAINQAPDLKNQGTPANDPTKVKCKLVDKSQIGKFASGTKFVELWAYEVTANYKGTGVVRDLKFGVGRQLDEDALTEKQKKEAIDVGTAITVSDKKFVISVDDPDEALGLNAPHYQVILAEDAP